MKIAKKIFELFSGFLGLKSGKYVFVKYYSEVINVGDILNIDLIKYYSGKAVINPPGSSRFKHYLVVGSILHNMNSKSNVLGSGIIHPDYVSYIKDVGKIKALRGFLTKKIIEDKFNFDLSHIPLGDPAILFPRIYNPLIQKKFSVGLVLHYVDENHPLRHLVESYGGKIISVRQHPRDFIDQILECENILSSSMHGLILADSYGIKNKRIVLSDNITGGDFKFRDYYSTTDNPNEKFLTVSEWINEDNLKRFIGKCSVKNYLGNIESLESLFINEVY